MAARLTDGGQGEPAWTSRRRSSNRAGVPATESSSRLRAAGAMNVVVGVGAPPWPVRTERAVSASKRLSTTQVPPRNRVAPANRTDTEWYIGEQTRWTSPGPNDHRSASSAKEAAASSTLQTPDHTPFDRPVVPEV